MSLSLNSVTLNTSVNADRLQPREEISSQNQKLLHKIAKKNEESLLKFIERAAPPQTTISTIKGYIGNWVFSRIPTKESLAEVAGKKAAVTYGPGLLNSGIKTVTGYAFGTKKPLTTAEWIKSQMFGAAKIAAQEGSRMWIIPAVAPQLALIGGPLGILSLKALEKASSLVQNYYSPNLNKFIKTEFNSLQDLTENAKNVELYDGEGNRITTHDLVKMRNTILFYDLSIKLSESKKNDIGELLSSYFFTRSDNKKSYFQNGKEMTPEQLRQVENTIITLQGAFCTSKDKKDIKETLLFLIENRENPLKEVDILYQTCDDGVIAGRDGQVISQEEYDNIDQENLNLAMQKKEEKLEEMISEFSTIRTEKEIEQEFYDLDNDIKNNDIAPEWKNIDEGFFMNLSNEIDNYGDNS